MPKVIPVPVDDGISKPFWDAVNEKKLVVQSCIPCSTLQYPPRSACQDCGSKELEWKETSGRGHILAYLVVEDGRLARRIPDQPYNYVVVALDEEPRINFLSNLPGVEVDAVPIGASVEVIFEEVAPGQLIHEWQLV